MISKSLKDFYVKNIIDKLEDISCDIYSVQYTLYNYGFDEKFEEVANSIVDNILNLRCSIIKEIKEI